LKRSGKIDASTTFTQGKLTIHPHDAIKATASVTPIAPRAKSIHPSQQLEQLVEASGFEMINIDNSKSADAATSVVWIDGMEGDLSGKPLQVSLQETVTDDSELVAMTMEDGVVQLIGLGAPNENGGYDMEIKTLPEDNQRKKSLIRAAWFCFVKVALRKDLSELRKVNYTDGKVEYDKNISQIIQPGQHVAVFVHGIIGNTKGMASSMEFLLTNKNYDLLLAFDYENLNTKIEKIAEKLRELLEKAGAGANAPVDIICHSMGGLVSRYMIEHVPDTDGWIKRLYMFGTPNAGSVFGEIPKMRDWAVGLLTLACNFGASWLGSIGVVLKSVNKVLAGSVVATYTLAEMADDSDFYKLLNKQEKSVATEYHIIAGNVLNFKPQDDDGRFEKIMEKIKKQVGEWAYGSTIKNDIAVAVQSIISAPKAYVKTNVEIACHHLNYFELDEPMKYFKTLIAGNNE
jgi:pimeloyl-ACP methyl ester carboxylesterase